MIKRLGATVMMLGAALTLSGGCMSSAPTVVTKEGDVYEVRANSMTLRNRLQLTRRNVGVTPSGLYRAQIEARNLTRRDVQFQYRYRWLDDQHMVVDSPMSIWRTASLGARSTEYFTATAPALNARDFVMEVRFVHDSTRW